MRLAPSLTSPAALYRKLERESYRAFHSRSRIHKADHFFNFCVTAHAMRDYLLEYLGKIERKDKQPYHELWNKIPPLAAARDIANSSKHFELRERTTGERKAVSTLAVRRRKSSYVELFSNGRGEFQFVVVEAPDISVKLSDGTVLLLYEFTHEVLAHWRSCLSQHGIKVRRQSLSRLSGNAA
jgi:hypothetical protein